MKEISQKQKDEAISFVSELINQDDYHKRVELAYGLLNERPGTAALAIEVTRFVKKMNCGKIRQYHYIFKNNHKLYGSYQPIYASSQAEARNRMKMVYGNNLEKFCIEIGINDEKSETIKESRLAPIYVLETDI